MSNSLLGLWASLASLAATAVALNAAPLDVDSFNGKRVMFITAHPDDIEGFAGGLVSTLGLDTNRSVEIAYLIITSGNAGGKCYDNSTKPPLPPSQFFECEKEDLAAIRRKESIQAAQFLGVHKVFRVGVDDGMSVAVHETRVRRAITAYIRTFKPHVVFTHGPNPDFDAPPTCNGACPAPKGWDDLGFHPDHQHVGTLVFNSVYGGGSAADNNLIFQDLDIAGVPGWRVEQLYFFALTANPMTHFFELEKDTLVNARYGDEENCITSPQLHPERCLRMLGAFRTRKLPQATFTEVSTKMWPQSIRLLGLLSRLAKLPMSNMRRVTKVGFDANERFN